MMNTNVTHIAYRQPHTQRGHIMRALRGEYGDALDTVHLTDGRIEQRPVLFIEATLADGQRLSGFARAGVLNLRNAVIADPFGAL